MPNLAGLIFSSVGSFVLQPERTKVVNKRDNLDTLAEVYTGPAGAEDLFIPAIGYLHPNYNLMSLINASVRQMPALVVEVTLNYQGKLANSGTGRYTSVPTISRYWQDGEISYESGYYTFSHRYTGRCVTIAYITNNIPSGNESNLGLAKEFLGFTNEWKQLVSINPSNGFVLQSGPIRKMTCTDVRTEDQGDGWFRVTETYMSQMFPGTIMMSTGDPQAAPPQKQTGLITIGSPVQDWYGTVPDLFGMDQRPTQSMQYQADSQGDSYTPTDAPTPGVTVTADQATYYNTGIDPAGANIPNATAAASGSFSTAYSGLGGADGSVSSQLDF